MRLTAGIVTCFLMVSATIAAAQKPVTCPWLSSGSAETVLGGPASLHLHMEADGQQGLCEFASQPDGTKVLRILVAKADKHVCPQGSMRLKALGNEAVQCRRPDAQGHPWDVIAGRMRDIFFVVTTSNVPDALAIPADKGSPVDPYGASILERATEQVVGNLN